MLLTLHSLFRWLLYLVGGATVGYAAFGWATRRPVDVNVRLLSFVFVGLVDLQILIGFLLALSRNYNMGALAVHILVALLAAAALHVVNSVMRRRPAEARTWPPYAIGSAICLALLIGAILLLGRPAF